MQHVEFGEARQWYYLQDLNKCIDWFGSHDPFDDNVPQLRYLSSGLAASVMKRRKLSVRYRKF